MNLPQSISFRRLRLDDLPLMRRWLNTGHVIEGYGKRHKTYEEVVEKYTPRIEGTVPTAPFLILTGDRPIGYIQTYRLADHPDYNCLIGAGKDVAGVDLFIGEGDCIHQGWGSVILRQFLREIVFAQEGITECVVGPDPKNRVAIRAYEKTGFRYWKGVRTPGGEDEYLMSIGREDIGL